MHLLQQESPGLSVRQRCRWLSMSRSWYDASSERKPQAAADLEATASALRDALERIVLDFPGYGSRRVTQALRRSGWPVNHQRVLRVMREEALRCQLKRRFILTTDSTHGERTSPHLLADAPLDRLDQAWVADSTSIRLPTTFVSLAPASCLLEACSRRCSGWKLARQIDTRLTLAALEMASDLRQPRRGLLPHADRGVQYASTDYVSRLEAIGARVSRSATGNPYDNAKAERCFKTLKREEVSLTDDQTFAEAEVNLGQFIEAVYNTKRLHSSLGYRPPAAFEAAYAQSIDEVTLPLVRY
jgi:putative transposase